MDYLKHEKHNFFVWELCWWLICVDICVLCFVVHLNIDKNSSNKRSKIRWKAKMVDVIWIGLSLLKSYIKLGLKQNGKSRQSSKCSKLSFFYKFWFWLRDNLPNAATLKSLRFENVGRDIWPILDFLAFQVTPIILRNMWLISTLKVHEDWIRFANGSARKVLVKPRICLIVTTMPVIKKSSTRLIQLKLAIISQPKPSISGNALLAATVSFFFVVDSFKWSFSVTLDSFYCKLSIHNSHEAELQKCENTVINEFNHGFNCSYAVEYVNCVTKIYLKYCGGNSGKWGCNVAEVAMKNNVPMCNDVLPACGTTKFEQPNLLRLFYHPKKLIQ